MTDLQNLDLDYLKGIAARVKYERETPKVERVPVVPVVTAPKKESKLIPKINPREYLKLGIMGLYGKPVFISINELKGSNAKSYEGTHEFLLEQGLYMPTPKIFMDFFNTIKTYQGRTLKYLDDSIATKGELNKIFNHLTTVYKNKFGRDDVGAWTWLNARFLQGKGCMNLDLETVLGKDKGILKTSVVPLDECINQDTYVDLDITLQGFSKYSSNSGSYSQGRNIYFMHPQNEKVTIFGINSSRAVLNCNWKPWDNAQGLGSFACFEGDFK